jgi:hypothetical protein
MPTCKGTFKSGQHEGKRCTHPAKVNGYCGLHQGQVSKPCPQGKVLNPVTKKCVNRRGARSKTWNRALALAVKEGRTADVEKIFKYINFNQQDLQQKAFKLLDLANKYNHPAVAKIIVDKMKKQKML